MKIKNRINVGIMLTLILVILLLNIINVYAQFPPLFNNKIPPHDPINDVCPPGTGGIFYPIYRVGCAIKYYLGGYNNDESYNTVASVGQWNPITGKYDYYYVGEKYLDDGRHVEAKKKDGKWIEIDKEQDTAGEGTYREVPPSDAGFIAPVISSGPSSPKDNPAYNTLLKGSEMVIPITFDPENSRFIDLSPTNENYFTIKNPNTILPMNILIEKLPGNPTNKLMVSVSPFYSDPVPQVIDPEKEIKIYYANRYYKRSEMNYENSQDALRVYHWYSETKPDHPQSFIILFKAKKGAKTVIESSNIFCPIPIK